MGGRRRGQPCSDARRVGDHSGSVCGVGAGNALAFPFNRDAARRDSMLHFYLGSAGQYSGGIASFDSLDAGGLAALIQAQFIDPYEQQNLAPTTWEIFQFLCRHPHVKAMGYAVSPDRTDYRTSLESINAEEIDAKLRSDAVAFCVDADEATFDGRLECFSD